MDREMSAILEKARKGIDNYLETSFHEGQIDRQSYELARKDVIINIEKWLADSRLDTISPNLKCGITDAIEEEKWEDIVNAFRKNMSFGTGGIRGLMANDKVSILKLKEDGIDARILKGPNTLNNVVLLLTSAGVAKFGREKELTKIVIGYDSRIRGYDFAKSIAELFLAYGFTVYLFDAPCPYPEVTFAIPHLKARMGILISASHNDYRYNGYKLSSGNGSQFDPDEREEMYDDYIIKSTTEDIQLLPIGDAPEGQIIFLGGDRKLPDFDYFGHGDSLVDIHKAHRDHVMSFLLQAPDAPKTLNIGFCPFHGAGRIAVPRLLGDIGFENIKITTRNGLYELNGMFPSFNSEPGKEQQPDPGDPRAARIAVSAFKEEYPDAWESTDVLLGTDPDADRCGVVVKVPENQRELYGGEDFMLMPADDMWALLLWYRLRFDEEIDTEKAFIALSHTTSDCITKIAEKHGVGVVKTWVGFANLAAAVRDTWDRKLKTGLVEGRDPDNPKRCHSFIYETLGMEGGKREYNLGAFEQSNGFSKLGFPPKDDYSLGEKGHVRDKDGTFAAVLIAEIAEWAKQNGTTIFEMIDKYIYLDPEIGLFINFYEPDPMDGEYPGIAGDRIKAAILRRTLGLYQFALAGGLEIGGKLVKSAAIYRTEKYDRIYPPTHDYQFPDEGVRFYFDDERLNHLTVRPSGTGNSLRFHIQVHSLVNEDNLIAKKKELHQYVRTMAGHIRELVKAPRSS